MSEVINAIFIILNFKQCKVLTILLTGLLADHIWWKENYRKKENGKIQTQKDLEAITCSRVCIFLKLIEERVFVQTLILFSVKRSRKI